MEGGNNLYGVVTRRKPDFGWKLCCELVSLARLGSANDSSGLQRAPARYSGA